MKIGITSIKCLRSTRELRRASIVRTDLSIRCDRSSQRAEKDRIYTITDTATDNAENKTVKTATEREEGFGAFLIVRLEKLRGLYGYL
ncbi:hypothetical protein DFP97_1167 [Paenibacillus prosopidis]|uniref:Uncharacterized protein n=1 Tax=Paenibacillus prosopidis TaxID=630520 RepID=A0A368VN76_9BACL|nr:hypothetical protein DFP97_1167 [Paenibacillus prosopidis]